MNTITADLTFAPPEEQAIPKIIKRSNKWQIY
jgi:hypothetical protein